MDNKFEKNINLLGENNFKNIINKKIIICGLGGVGGYVAEMISRLGINNIVLVDFDIVTITNFNRQIIAIDDNINKYKIDCFANRIHNINQNCNITTINDKINDSFFEKYNNQLKNSDFLFDCIDDKYAKINIYKYCKKYNISFISSMGTGNNILENFEITDIKNTKYCPLSKAIRKLCNDNNLSNITVIYNNIQTASSKKGTIPTIPSIAGIMMVQYFINQYLIQQQTQ